MSDKKPTVEEKIHSLEREIDREISNYQENLPSTIQSLLNKVIHVHGIVEEKITLIVACEYLRDAAQFVDTLKVDERVFGGWSDLIGKASDLFDQLPFSRKIAYFKDIGCINHEQYKLLTKFNKIRNNLAHIKGNKYKEFMDRSKYLEALSVTKESLTEINKIEIYFDILEKEVQKRKKFDTEDIPF